MFTDVRKHMLGLGIAAGTCWGYAPCRPPHPVIAKRRSLPAHPRSMRPISICSAATEPDEPLMSRWLADKNVTSIEMEVPIACLTNGTEPVIGGRTSASLRQGRLLNPTPNSGSASKEGGAWTQVSRLGMPLVNEVVIGLKDKDQFNHSKPA
jgi:Domain of unknown function (DUF4331)